MGACGGACTMSIKMTPWDEEQDARLRAVYPTGTWEDLAVAFPCRTRSSIHKRAFKLRIERVVRILSVEARAKLIHRLVDTPPRLGTSRVVTIEVDGVVGKECNTCSQWRPLEKYACARGCAGGRRHICTTCEGKQAYAKNPERILRLVRAYQKRYPDKVRRTQFAAKRMRYERIMAGPGVSVGELEAIAVRAGGRCAYCDGANARTYDHVVPLARGGRHEASNLVLACRSCNSRKSTKSAEEFMAQRKGATDA